MGLQQPVFLDSTVLSNFASTDSVDWLIGLLEDPAVTPEVARELREGMAAEYEFLQPAVDAIDDGIQLVEISTGTPEAALKTEERDHLDPGEQESAICAGLRDGTLATDDLAARELLDDSDTPVTVPSGSWSGGSTGVSWTSRRRTSGLTLGDGNGATTPRLSK